MTVADVQTLVMDLHEKGLLITERAGQGISLLNSRRERRVKEWRQKLLNPMYLRLPGWDPDGTLARMEPYVGWFFRWWAVLPTFVFVLFAYLFSRRGSMNCIVGYRSSSSSLAGRI
ncbi:MAG: hypothetical protein R3B90_06710 [Planctomycetaceae bacterium]